jgi:hypothetical protein
VLALVTAWRFESSSGHHFKSCNKTAQRPRARALTLFPPRQNR